MDLNLQPYPLLRIDDLTYSFTTIDGDVYKCAFLSYSGYFLAYPELATKIYAFNLELEAPPPKRKGIDKRIADTAVKIVGDFLNSQINAVVYVCDPTDGKGPARARLFKSWFNYYEHPSNQIIQVSSNFDAGGITLYTTLLVHKKNKLKIQFIEAYDELTGIDEEK